MTELKPFAHNDTKLLWADPFTLVDRDGNVWNSASDRVWFVAFQGKAKHKRWAGHGHELNTMLKFIHLPPDKPHTIDVDAVSVWVDECDREDGSLLGVVVTLSRLKKLLASAPDKTVSMWKATKMVADERCLAFGVEGQWRALLMGHSTKPDGLPAYKSAEAEMSAFDLAMSFD